MNIVEHVEIKGFWGDKVVDIDFSEDANFLIGMNGSGKTTAINLLAAALQADFSTLDRLQFKSISITLREVGGKGRKPSIVVKKKSTTRTPYSAIAYEVRDQASGKAKVYSLDEFENQRMLRTAYASSGSYPNRALIQRRISKGMLQHLHQLINVNWLSIHRSTFDRRYADDEGYESTIDMKLKNLGDGFVRFFSAISKGKDELLEEFQKRVFLSLIELPKESVITSELDLDYLTKGLIGIYEDFEVDTQSTKRRLGKYTTELKKGLDFLASPKDATPDFKAVVTAYFAPRVSEVVSDWWALKDKQAIVEASKTTFLNLINDMLLDKEFLINEKNELVAVTKSGKRLTARQLSSGEKQLLIILGDALLTAGSPHVYIADEPELSLHVDWQERLISTLREINPQAQVIVATHSPDIVGAYRNRTIRMEKVIS